MCVLIFVLKKKNNDKLNDLLVNNAKDFLDSNNDGVSMVYGIDGKIEQYKSVKPSIKLIEDKINKADFFGGHFRFATKGKKSIENCHFWQYKNWLFAHNGTIGDLGNEEMCDSREFFDKLIAEKFLDKKKLPIEDIQKYIFDSRFTGRCVLFDVKKKLGYFFGDFKVMSLDKNYLAISSSDLEMAEMFRLFGVRFELEKKYDSTNTDIEKLEVELEGVHMVNFYKKIVWQLADTYTEPYETYGAYKKEIEYHAGKTETADVKIINEVKILSDSDSVALADVDREAFAKASDYPDYESMIMTYESLNYGDRQKYFDDDEIDLLEHDLQNRYLLKGI